MIEYIGLQNLKWRWVSAQIWKTVDKLILIVFPMREPSGPPLLSWICRAGHDDLLTGVVSADRKLDRRFTLINYSGLIAMRVARARNITVLVSERGIVWLWLWYKIELPRVSRGRRRSVSGRDAVISQGLVKTRWLR